MDLALNLFGNYSTEGYISGKDIASSSQVACAEDDDGDYELDIPEGISISKEGNLPLGLVNPEGPFSALIPSIIPQELLFKINNSKDTEDPNEQPKFRFDEFGFKVEEESPEQVSNKLLSTPFIEDPQQRLMWIAYLEFTHNSEVGDLTWDKVQPKLLRTDKLCNMVRSGIPHSLRPQIWMRLSGALEKKMNSDVSYKEIVRASSNDHLMVSRQIEKDLLRTLPSNACFSIAQGTGIARLRRVLRGIGWLYPDLGYCQGVGVIGAILLLLLEEEDAFWLLSAIVEDLLPASYYTPSLIGVQADQRVLRQLLVNFLPSVDTLLRDHDIELSLIALPWFVTLFTSVLHIRVLLRVWDLFFCEGSAVLFRMALAMIRTHELHLKELQNSADIFNALSDLPRHINEVDELIDLAYSLAGSFSDVTLDSYRRRHLAYLMSDRGTLVGNPESAANLPKQHLSRRKVKTARPLLQLLLFGDEEDQDDIRSKNVRQTEVLVDLREAVLQIGRHFHLSDPRLAHISLIPDYSMDSHAKDHETYAGVMRSKKRRAKALLDFERHDDDELGFRKNDLITVISQKDEDCWIGELNGLRGWFPAKFVQLLDERSKQYSSAGDDSVSENIAHLVRGSLAPTIKQVLEHGMKRSSILGSICHPWLFIEEAANKEVERDFASVYSRLILCKTFRLDEDGKVLTPEELLYRCVQAVNITHDAVHAQMDVKLRSLICMGLNEQVLHLWLEVLGSSIDTIQKWYYPGSFLASPGWVQVKCDLRLLSQFPFILNPDWELPTNKKSINRLPLKEGVRDMLVKHHLFSWDL